MPFRARRPKYYGGFTLCDFESLDLVGHEHEGRSKNNGVEAQVRVRSFHLIEIHELDADVVVALEQFFGSRDVVLIDVNPDDPGIFVGVDDGVKGVTSGSPNIENSLGLGAVSLLDSSVSSPG